MGIVLGILPVSLLPQLPPIVFCHGLLLVSLLGCHPKTRFVGGCVLGCAIACYAGHQLLADRLSPHCNGRALTVQGVVSSLPINYRGSTGPHQRFLLRVQSLPGWAGLGCGQPKTLLLSWYGEPQFHAGERWQLNTKLRYPWGLLNPVGFNRQAWLSQAGIDATGTVKRGGAELLGGQGGVGTRHHQVREQLRNRINTLQLPEQVIALLTALVIGDKSAITSDLWQTLRLLGISHLVVISGLHIGLAAGLGFIFGKLLGQLLPLDSQRWAALSAMALATAYALLAGLSLSTVRALVMLYCLVLAQLFRRPPRSWAALLIALVLVLIWQPLAALNSGFWLSFGAVAALLWLSAWQSWRPRWLQVVLAHGYMSLAMVPAGLLFFGGVSLISVLGNLLLVPLFSVVIVPLVLLATLLSLLGSTADSPVWALVGWMLNYLLTASEHLLPTLQASAWWQASAGSWVLLLLVVALVLVVPGGMKGARYLCLLPGFLLPALGPKLLPAGVTDVWVLDVGQGTAVLVHSANRALLYDTGGAMGDKPVIADQILLPLFMKLGIGHLDQLVVSHADRDHSAGADSISRQIPVTQVLVGAALPGREHDSPCVAGSRWSWVQSQTTFRVLAPALHERPRESNNRSCVLQADIGGFKLLLAGDIDAGRERELVRNWGSELSADWLLVGHHGSNSSSSHSWLKTVQAQHLVLSHAYASAFGHPHPEVLKRLSLYGGQTYSTAKQGALRFRIREGHLEQVTAWREHNKRYWFGGL